MTSNTRIVALLASLWLSLTALNSLAQESAEAPPSEPAEVAPEAAPPDATAELDVEKSDEEDTDRDPWRHERYGHDAIVKFGADVHLGRDESADAVFTMFGSATSEGRIRDAIVSMFGDTRVTGPVGDAAVALFGDTYVDSRVGGDVFAMFGSVELGPNADVGGEAAVLGGTIRRHPDAIVRGGINEVSFGPGIGLDWLQPWIRHCLLLGRPLAFEPGLDWAWAVAGVFLALYVLIALLFGGAVERCVRTLEDRPGESVLASLVTVFLSPILAFLLLITIVGAVIVPFFGLALFVAGLFGKAVVFAALGRRITRHASSGPLAHIAFATLIGGLIVTAIYLVPFLGFITYKLLGILGLGVVIYTLLLLQRERRARAPFVTPEGVTVEAPIASASSTPGTVASEPSTASAAPGAADPQAATASRASPSAPPPIVTASLPRADFWIRMGALLIDAILVAIIAGLIPGSGDIWLLALATYGAIMWKIKGTTVGGIICNLRVVRLDGREIDWATAIVRALGCFLSMIVVGLGFLWIAFDPERQGWHDKIAGTVVVRVPKPGSLV